jgi:uncharacterized Ntn-hydrolase superfamily protein
MTFSIIGRCARTGQIGVAVASPSIAIGARVAYCAAGVGAVLTQHRTDPRLGPRGIELLRAGSTAQQTIDALIIAAAPNAQWRQLAAMDSTGATAVFSGSRTRPEMSEAPAQDACAIGNELVNHRSPPAMLREFQSIPGLPLAERLVRALEAGLAAGGEPNGPHSAQLLVVATESFALIDLRVDWHEQPIAELRDLWQRYAPQTAFFVQRALDPDHAA